MYDASSASGNEVRARVEELKRTISEGVVQLEIRQRNARVQILQNNLDAMRRVIAARAFKYSADMGGATGLMMKDYRGKNATIREVLKRLVLSQPQKAATVPHVERELG